MNTNALKGRMIHHIEYADDTYDEELEITATMPPHPSSASMGIGHLARGNLPCYPSNIAAACHAASVGHSQPKPIIVEDALKLEKRRRSNRLSAQRWRMRKRTKFTDLQDQIRLLQREHDQLEREKSRLQADLQMLLTVTQAQTRHLPSSFVNARLEGSQHVLQLSQSSRMEENLDWTLRAPPQNLAQEPPFRGDPNGDANCFTQSGIPLKAFPEQFHYPCPVGWQTESQGSPSSSLAGNVVSHTQLRAMLRAASSPCFSLQP